MAFFTPRTRFFLIIHLGSKWCSWLKETAQTVFARLLYSKHRLFGKRSICNFLKIAPYFWWKSRKQKAPSDAPRKTAWKSINETHVVSMAYLVEFEFEGWMIAKSGRFQSPDLEKIALRHLKNFIPYILIAVAARYNEWNVDFESNIDELVHAITQEHSASSQQQKSFRIYLVFYLLAE